MTDAMYLRAEFKKLREHCQNKRQGLFHRAQLQDKRRRILHLASGIMALLSGATTSSLLIDFTGAAAVKIIAALFAFISGFISLVLNTYANSKETDTLFEGSAQFLVLRDRADLEYARVNASAESLQRALQSLRTEYAKASQKYDRYIKDFQFLSEHFGLGKGQKTKPLLPDVESD